MNLSLPAILAIVFAIVYVVLVFTVKFSFVYNKETEEYNWLRIVLVTLVFAAVGYGVGVGVNKLK